MDILFQDDNGKETTNLVLGRPLIPVTVSIQGQIIAKSLGLIDTGARNTYIREDLVEGLRPDGSETNNHGGGSSPTKVFSDGWIQIGSFGQQMQLRTFPSEQRSFVALIGRDVLQFFRLRIDPQAQIYALDEV